MAGHSKWANIKHRKAKQDALKGKIFTKLIRAITSAARHNPDMDANAALRLAIHKAYEANMSQDTIKKAIARGEGQGNEDAMHRIIYEGYGVEGIAYMVITLTDNRNRTVAEVRHAFDKCGGMLSVEGSVAYLFDYKSWVTVEGALQDKDLEAILSWVDDVIDEDGAHILLCHEEHINTLQNTLTSLGYTILEAETGYRPQVYVKDVSAEILEKHEKLMDKLLDCDDVQEVYHNLDA